MTCLASLSDTLEYHPRCALQLRAARLYQLWYKSSYYLLRRSMAALRHTQTVALLGHQRFEPQTLGLDDSSLDSDSFNIHSRHPCFQFSLPHLLPAPLRAPPMYLASLPRLYIDFFLSSSPDFDPLFVSSCQMREKDWALCWALPLMCLFY